VVDFGLCKRLDSAACEAPFRAWTLCGTPEYMAPEILTVRGGGAPPTRGRLSTPGSRPPPPPIVP
jgi:serine/threonine protein kinase